jgi:hypothetical protein
MPIWVDPTRKVPYVLEAERGKPEAEQTRFLLRVMSARDYVRFSQEVTFTTEGKVKNFVEYTTAILRYALAGWEGPGAPPFEVDAEGHPTEATLSRLTSDDRYELGLAADEVNRVTGDDAGKSP